VTRHEEKNSSIDQTDPNLFAASGDYRCFAFEYKFFSAPAINAFFTHLGKRFFSIQILVKSVKRHILKFS
jgi:hypothetical protein